MYLDEVIEKLMNMDEQTCPCEIGIPCLDYHPNKDGNYCQNGFCLDGMVRLVRKMVREGK